jgi:hypothetical protein
MHNITTNMMYKKKFKKKSATGEGIVGRGDFGMFVGRGFAIRKKKNRPAHTESRTPVRATRHCVQMTLPRCHSR